ncbi:MAG: hypothetical protein QXO07_01570 [Candidatus Aenigmatarchaeota archaeon]
MNELTIIDKYIITKENYLKRTMKLNFLKVTFIIFLVILVTSIILIFTTKEKGEIPPFPSMIETEVEEEIPPFPPFPPEEGI